jgi:hypothetical protein
MLIFNWVEEIEYKDRNLFVYLFKICLFYEEYFLGEISKRRDN